MPTVSITQTPRSLELKRRLIAEITRAVVTVYGVRPEQVSVHFYELDRESLGHAGVLAADTRRADTSREDD